MIDKNLTELIKTNDTYIEYGQAENTTFGVEVNVNQVSFQESPEFAFRFYSEEGTDWFMSLKDTEILVQWLQNKIKEMK